MLDNPADLGYAETMNTTDTALLVQKALEHNYGLWVSLDIGDVDLFGDDLRTEWDNLAPGEGFEVLGIITDDVRREF